MDKLEHTELAIVRWRRRLRRALSELDKLEKRKLRYEKNTRRIEGADQSAPNQVDPPVTVPAPPPRADVATVKARKSKEQMKPKPGTPGPELLAALLPPIGELRAANREARMKALGFRSTRKKK